MMMPQSKHSNRPRLISTQFVLGYAHGLHQPCVVLRMQFDRAVTLNSVLAKRLDDALTAHYPRAVKLFGQRTAIQITAHAPPLLACVLRWVALLHEITGLPALQPGKVLSSSESNEIVLAIPTLAPEATTHAVQILLNWAHDLWTTPALPELFEAAINALADVQGALKLAAPGGENTYPFIRAAHALDVPWQRLGTHLFQYGQGARARWLDSTFTDATPQIAAALARNKINAASLLHRAGLPVPPHQRVDNLKEALRAAQQLGYPVVVKPANCDGGVGVSAGLHSAAEVEAAWARARPFSSMILVEKHLEGRDYRLYVYQGTVIWANERVPASVVGDGTLSVENLVTQENTNPRRGDEDWSELTTLVLNAEADELLQAQGLTRQSIPQVGQFVRLRRAANVSSGGRPVGMLHCLHPDNARLAVRAATVLRLDLAGVDLLLPDISVSWLDSGGGICEVNGQPQLSFSMPHAHRIVLQRLLPDSGRIPIVVVWGPEQEDSLGHQLEQALAAQGWCVGMASMQTLRVAGHEVRRGPHAPFAATQALLTDPQIQALVVCTDGREWLHTGLPFDYFDVLVLAPGAETMYTTPGGADRLALLLQACATGVAAPVGYTAPTQIDLRTLTWQPCIDLDAVVQTAVAFALQANKTHRAPWPRPDNPPPPIWFVLGLAGAGKSTFSHFAAEQLGWAHFELDPHDIPRSVALQRLGMDQVPEQGSLGNNSPMPIDKLIEALRRATQISGRRGAVVSFSGGDCITEADLQQLHALGIQGFYLMGPSTFCAHSYGAREGIKGPALAALWDRLNAPLLQLLSQTAMQKYVLQTFHTTGTRRTKQDMLNEILKRFAGPTSAGSLR